MVICLFRGGCNDQIIRSLSYEIFGRQHGPIDESVESETRLQSVRNCTTFSTVYINLLRLREPY